MSKEPPPPYAQPPYPQQGPPPMGFAPPPQGMPPPTQTVVITTAAMGPSSQTMVCPSCHHNISTRLEVEPNTKTHMFALLLCLFGCWLCCCIPYCMDSCQSTNHYCPNCKAYIGAYSP